MFGARPLSFTLILVAFSSALALESGTRKLPARDIPVPTTASLAAQVLIGAPLSPIWNAHPKSAEEWKALVPSARAWPTRSFLCCASASG